jgi:hypothetical protein
MNPSLPPADDRHAVAVSGRPEGLARERTGWVELAKFLNRRRTFGPSDGAAHLEAPRFFAAMPFNFLGNELWRFAR